VTEGMRKAQDKANQLLNKARRERDRKGYRENLGYDKCQVLQDYCSEVGLSYSETSHVLAYFEEGCDAL